MKDYRTIYRAAQTAKPDDENDATAMKKYQDNLEEA
jgi:hypothetical protein